MSELPGFASEVNRRYITLPKQGKSAADILQAFPWSPAKPSKAPKAAAAEAPQEPADPSEDPSEPKQTRKRRPGGGRKPKPKDEAAPPEAAPPKEAGPKNKGGRPTGAKDSKPRVRRTKAQLEAARRAEASKNP